MPYVENLEEFSQRQDCERIWDDDRQVSRFENGAFAKTSGSYTEPPDDEQEKLRRYGGFLRCKRRLLAYRYQTMKRQISDQLEFASMKAGPMPEAGWESELQAMVENIEALDKEIEQVREQLTPQNVEPGSRERQRVEARQGLSVLKSFPALQYNESSRKTQSTEP